MGRNTVLDESKEQSQTRMGIRSGLRVPPDRVFFFLKKKKKAGTFSVEACRSHVERRHGRRCSQMDLVPGLAKV